MDAYNQFIQKFHNGTLEFPYDYQEFEDDDFVQVEDWCLGFSQAVKMRGDLWMPNVDSEEIDEMQDEIISCIAIVGACSDPLNADKFFDHEYSTDPKIKKDGYEVDKLIAMLFGNLPMAVESLTEIGAEMAAYNQNIASPIQPVRSLEKLVVMNHVPVVVVKNLKNAVMGLMALDQRFIDNDISLVLNIIIYSIVLNNL